MVLLKNFLLLAGIFSMLSACSKVDESAQQKPTVGQIEKSSSTANSTGNSIDQCVDAKIAEFKKEMGADRPINADLLQDWEQSCGASSVPKETAVNSIATENSKSTELLIGTAGDGNKWFLIDAGSDGNYRIPSDNSGYLAVIKTIDTNNNENFFQYQINCNLWQIRGFDTKGWVTPTPNSGRGVIMKRVCKK